MSELAHLANAAVNYGCSNHLEGVSCGEYAIQVQASYSCTTGKANQDMILLTSSTNEDLNISLSRQELLKDSDTKTPHLLIKVYQHQNLRAFPMTYNIGQIFYDIKENKCWKIVDIPLPASSSHWDRKPYVPVYTVEYSSTVVTKEVAETNPDLDPKLAVGPKH